MLNAGNRRLLLDSLRPPPGFELDRCLGTTYSLDLQALLTAPLAFTLFQQEDQQGRPNSNPLALLDSLRRFAVRMHIFCQSGKIQIPKIQQRLFSYLEDCVIQVSPAGDRVFHPKLWLLRYISGNGELLYRLLCLSRNLTFDRSWDSILCLEGEPTDREEGQNQPLIDFLQDLSEMAGAGIPARARESVSLFARELQGISFQPPHGFENIAFHPLGTPRAQEFSFPAEAARMLIVSPFLTSGTIQGLADRYPGSLLLSRLEALQELSPDSLQSLRKILILPEEISSLEADAEDSQGDLVSLRGLHAKLYVLDSGQQARVYTGSANATRAGLQDNVEFLVEMRGWSDKAGIEAMLGQSAEKDSLWHMLQEYLPRETWPEPVDGMQEQLERDAERALHRLAQTGLQAGVEALDDELFQVSLATNEMLEETAQGTRLECWPVTLPEGHKQSAQGGQPEFGFTLSLESLTAFFAFRAICSKGEKSASAGGVLKAELRGAPKNRFQLLLQAVLENKSQLLRMLLLLLSEEQNPQEAIAQQLESKQSRQQGRYISAEEGLPLLEYMLRTLHRDPAKLDRVQNLVQDLCRSPKGRELLPQGFMQIWSTIWSTRQALQ